MGARCNICPQWFPNEFDRDSHERAHRLISQPVIYRAYTSLDGKDFEMNYCPDCGYPIVTVFAGDIWRPAWDHCLSCDLNLKNWWECSSPITVCLEGHVVA